MHAYAKPDTNHLDCVFDKGTTSLQKSWQLPFSSIYVILNIIHKKVTFGYFYLLIVINFLIFNLGW
jgi:hypothetical protein